jgi:predicted acylesterase/phospholipase RssA
MAMAEQPQHDANSPSEECDIVMKGGITSGVVYPSAVLRLSQRYRFRSIGGASVGAIAAAVTAAAEYGRQTGKGAGFARFNEINEELAREGFLLSLFKPRESARSIYELFLTATQKRGAVRMLAKLVGQAPWVVLPLLAWWGTLALTAWWLGDEWWLVPTLLVGWGLSLGVMVSALARRFRVGLLLVGVFLALLWPVAVAVPAAGLRAWRELSRNGFGLVPGASPGADSVCDWLHAQIQATAGLDGDHPLTFGMLSNDIGRDGKPVGIDLQMTTTDVSIARPLRLPRELEGFSFDPEDLREVLPAPVLRWLVDRGAREGRLVRMPSVDDLPVLLAFRMSLSFPVMFTAVRLYSSAPETLSADAVPHWFSDGGIGSNFPIHFFDAWMPSRPTFALSFAPFPLDREGRILPDESDIGLPPAPNGSRLPRWVEVTGVGGFFGQMLDTMQNWRDTLQSELPGFRDRVFETRLDKAAGEGGLNVGMDAATIGRLQDRGRRLGEAIAETFDMDQHFFNRYLVAMQQLELVLLGGEVPGTAIQRSGIEAAFAARRKGFADGDVGAGELFGRDVAWLPGAGAATGDLVELAKKWERFGRFVSDQPRPHPVTRVVPDV